MNSFEGTTQITNEGIKKHFKNFEPMKAIFELIWNGLDANSKTVHIKTIYTELDGLERIEIVDNGDGIDIDSLDTNFNRFNESTKKHDDDKHGSHGKGRLAFHILSGEATWFTKREGVNSKIVIDESKISNYFFDPLNEIDQHPELQKLKSGTCVVLTNIVENKLPSEENIISALSIHFGWYLALNGDRAIELNGKPIPIPLHELHEKKIIISEEVFEVKVIRWEDKPSSEKSHNYLIGQNKHIIKKQLSKTNNKVSFYTSAYAFSPWLETYDPDVIELIPNQVNSQDIARKVFEFLTQFQQEIYKDFLIRHVDQEIEKYDERGYFPSYNNLSQSFADFRKRNTKSVLKSLYIADPKIFNTLHPKPTKILIRLLDKLLVSNENDTLIDVLEGVLDLDSEKLSQFTSQLKKSKLENIISTIESLQRRQQAVHELKEIMLNRSSEVLETPDLQKIIENNTWLFGPQYTTLGAEEDTFNKLAIRLRNEVKDINIISQADIDVGSDLDGINRQVDLFLARKVATFDSSSKKIFKCIIIEIKRPGIALNKQHLRQIDDYAEILSKHPAFGSSNIMLEIILVGRKISKDDVQIKSRLNGLKDKAEFGLVTSSDRLKCYVKDWFTIFDEFELSNEYLLENLNTHLEDCSDVSTSNLVQNLQTN